MKKYLSLLLLLVFSLVLVSCGGGTTGGDNTGGGNGGGNVTGKITLTYASWGDANLDALLIKEFESTHPGVKVVRDDSITGTGNSFTANLVTAAQSGILPDVFITDNVISMIRNGLVSDVAEYWDKDEDSKLVYENIAQTALYGDKRYAIPSFQFIKGMLVNKTLLESIGAPIPDYDWTFEEFKQYCVDYANKATVQYGSYDVPVQGINGFAPNGGEGTLGFEQVMPGQDSDTLLYDAYDGTTYKYSDPLWIKYRGETDYFFDNGLVESMTAEDKAAIFGAEDAYLFEKGVVMFGIEGSWNASNVISNMAANGIEVDFYPFPAGLEHQIPVILDFICVSSQTLYPEMAYEFAKFMSYGREGWAARLEATEELNQVINGFPVADYPEIWAELKAGYDVDTYGGGLLANIELLPAGIPDADKWMPGYGEFWVWVGENAETQGFWDKTPDELAIVWEEELAKQIAAVKEELGL